MPVLKKPLVGDYKLATFERALLGHLIAFQEFRTPWARASFQKMELHLAAHMMGMATQAPRYLEKTLDELKEKGEIDGSLTAAQMRDALGNKKVKLVARPHARIDAMVSTAKSVGHFYTQMHWTVFRATEGKFLTSDAPVVRRDPGFGGGFYA